VLAGFDAVLIANFSDKILFTLHSAPEVNSLQDLKGKIIGVSGLGGSTEFATRVALRYSQEPPGIQLIEPMTGLIFNGVLDRHPKVKIVMAEAGLAWVPSMIQGLDI
jgi:hypothetical protein